MSLPGIRIARSMDMIAVKPWNSSCPREKDGCRTFSICGLSPFLPSRSKLGAGRVDQGLGAEGAQRFSASPLNCIGVCQKDGCSCADSSLILYRHSCCSACLSWPGFGLHGNGKSCCPDLARFSGSASQTGSPLLSRL